jgi:hypothetical protein
MMDINRAIQKNTSLFDPFDPSNLIHFLLSLDVMGFGTTCDFKSPVILD